MKTSVSTTHCRLNEFEIANRTFWVWYHHQKYIRIGLASPVEH